MIRGRVASCAAVAAAIRCLFLLSLWATAPVALAADIKVMSTVALNAVLDDLKPKFESASGNKLNIVYGLIADLKKRVQDGETADVILLSRAALDDLQTQGKVAPGTSGNFAHA